LPNFCFFGVFSHLDQKKLLIHVFKIFLIKNRMRVVFALVFGGEIERVF